MLGYEAISSTGRSSFQAERIERIVSSFLPLCRSHVNFTRSIETGILFIYLYVFTYLRETSVINQIFPIHYIRDCKKRNSSKRLTRTSTFVSSSWKWTKCACVRARVCVWERSTSAEILTTHLLRSPSLHQWWKNKVPVTFHFYVPWTSATFSSAKEFVFPKIPFQSSLLFLKEDAQTIFPQLSHPSFQHIYITTR